MKIWEIAVKIQTTLDPEACELSDIVVHAREEADAAIVDWAYREIGLDEVEESARCGLNLEEPEEEEEPDQPGEEDIVIRASRGAGSLEAFYLGKIIAQDREYEEVAKNVATWMKANNFFPTVWLESDHGNLEPVRDFPYFGGFGLRKPSHP